MFAVMQWFISEDTRFEPQADGQPNHFSKMGYNLPSTWHIGRQLEVYVSLTLKSLSPYCVFDTKSLKCLVCARGSKSARGVKM